MSKKAFQSGFALGLAAGGVVQVENTTKLDELETLIDESGVLDSTQGTATEKVEQLIDYAKFKNIIQENINKDVGSRCYVFNSTSIEDVSMFDFSQRTDMQFMFEKSSIKTLEIDFSIVTNALGICSYCRSLTTVIVKNMSSVTTELRRMFYTCDKLEQIIGELDMSGMGRSDDNDPNNYFNRIFGYDRALKEVRFVKNSIPLSIYFGESSLLSAESIQSIIDGLATVETAQTLTLHQNIILTDEQKATINSKGWTLAQ